MIKAAIFDFGGVLTTTPRVGLHRYESELGVPRGALLRLIVGDTGADDGGWQRLERGELSVRKFWREIRRRGRDELGVSVSLRGVARSIAGTFGPRAHMVELVRELGQTLVTVLLTNNVAEFGSLWRPMIAVDELFDAVIDSSAVGIRKPDPRIFQLALEAAGSRPEETIFVDDTLENVEAAERLGITAIYFTDEAEAIARIRQLTSPHQAQAARAL